MTIKNINANNSSQKKGGSSSFASAPMEDQSNGMNDVDFSTGVVVDAEPVTDPYGAGSNSNVPFVHAMSVELQQPSSYTTATATGQEKPRTSMPVAYSAGAPPQPPRPQPSIAVATGAPIQQAQPTASAQQRGNNANRNQDDCCNGRCCCGVTAIVVTAIIFICCVLPFIIAGATMASVSSNSYDDDAYAVNDVSNYDDNFDPYFDYDDKWANNNYFNGTEWVPFP